MKGLTVGLESIADRRYNRKNCRATLGWTAGGGCPYARIPKQKAASFR